MEIECTQRLECTQEHDTQFERTNPDQVGYLGICGNKYPVSKGPNKIGRDPKSCSIVINSNSISRHHAVINVLNMKEFMLMDLDSVNKTKVQGNTLQPYIPHPLKNFDMVQFGDIFGIFRLLEDSDDLPMTQAVDIPCTPVQVSKQISRCGAPSVLIPESPEVSDKDDSFIMPSQPIQTFKSPVNKFLKPSNKAVAIQPVGSKKIDNAYWQSGKKSEAFYLDDSGSTLNDSTASLKSNRVIDDSNDNIHEMETQEPYKMNESTDSIYTAETQPPPPSPSIHFMETQQPVTDIHGLETQQPDDIHNINTQNVVETIHNCATQAPIDNISQELQNISNHDDVKSDLPADSKNVDTSIYNAETQMFFTKEEDVESKKEDSLVESIKDEYMVEAENDDDDPIEPNKPAELNRNSLEKSKDKNDSDEEILFDEINTQSIEESFESQQLLPAELSPQIDKIEPIRVTSKSVNLRSPNGDAFEILPTQKITFDTDMPPVQKIINDIDILPTQKIINDIDILPTQKIINDIDMLPTQKINNDDEDLTDCEDDFANDEFKKPKSPEVDFEDMATQILGDDEIAAELPQSKDQIDGASKDINFEDMPTQVISDDSRDDSFENMPTQIIIEDDANDSGNAPITDKVDSPFKIPVSTPMKNKKNSSLALKTTAKPKETIKENVDDPNYYAATQDIFNDLCSQKEQSPNDNKQESIKNEPDNDDDLVPCSVEECQTDDRLPHLDNNLTPVKLTPSIDGEPIDQKINANSKQKSSTKKSNIDNDNRTPKPLKIMNTDLPDSQEIKTSVTLHRHSITESSSDTEVEELSDQESKITHTKKRSKVHAKIDLTKKFEESLPSRIITRVRKPTYKIMNSDESTKNQCKSILKNSVLRDDVENIDSEIINENISRLKSKSEKKREKDDSNKSHTEKSKKHSSSRRSEESKEESNSVSKSRSSRSKSKKSKETKSNHRSHNDSDSERELRRSSRSSRSKKEKDSKHDKSKHDKNKKTESKENERSDSKSRNRTRHDKKEAKTNDGSKSKDTERRIKTDSSPEMEIPRSKRQKASQNNEISTVYCLSSDSSLGSPKPLKRPACNELEAPSPKRTRSLPNSKSESVSTSSNASGYSTPLKSEVHYVLFTAFSNDDVRIKLENLGAVLVTDVMECTVLVTLQVKRTFKLLCAVGLGRPIVGPAWVQACADTNTIVDPWQYIVKDEPAERRFRFSLERTLRGNRGFLRGYTVSSTPSVLPNAQEMKLIVECSGGAWGEGGANWVVVSSSADRALWPALRRRGANIVSTEFILGGVLRQEADLASASFGPVEQKKKPNAGEFVCGACGRRCLSRIGLSSHAKSHTKS